MNNRGIRYILNIIFFFFAIVSLFPFYWVFALSTHSTSEILTGFPIDIGNDIWKNFKTIVDKSLFFKALMNSVIVSSSVTVLNVIFSVLCGFAFAKYRFFGRNLLFICVLATMMIPIQMGLVAYVKLMQYLHLYNTFWPLILSLGTAYGVFWMRQYISEYIPSEMLEAARMEGCGEIGLVAKIVFPLVMPAAGSYGIISFILSWNSFLMPLLILQDESRFTLPLAVASMQNRLDIDYGAQFLAITIGTLPLIAVFLMFSRKIIDGISDGAIKG